MNTVNNHFPLGFGTARFDITEPDDKEGFNRSVELVKTAIRNGVNYFDTAFGYSAGMGLQIMKKALEESKDYKVDFTMKCMYGVDNTVEEVKKRAEFYLDALGVDYIKFFLCWSVYSRDIFHKIMEKGGMYDGAVELKKAGIIDSICCSIHADFDDTIYMIESKVFDVVTISYSLLNASNMKRILDVALENGVGVVVMNPLGGGIIAQNQDFFSFSKYDENETTVQAALRFVKSHPAINIALNGISNESELLEGVASFNEYDPEEPAKRYERVIKSVSNLSDFCTGCKYCDPCPKGIKIHEIMQARNTIQFKYTEFYNRTEPEIVENLSIFRKLNLEFQWNPESDENPCIECGICESKCTQHLKIIDGIEDVYRRIGAGSYSVNARKEKVTSLIYNKGYNNVGIYPNGIVSRQIVDYYNQTHGTPPFKWILFNSGEDVWGTEFAGNIIHPPTDIEVIKPEIVIIATYKFDEEIYQNIKKYEQYGVKIIKLYEENDMPWIL